LTAYSLRTRAGFVSHRQRSWDLPFGAFSSRMVSRALPPRSPHLPFRLSVLPSRKRWAGPDRLRFLGFHPFESPWRPGKGLVCQPLDAPLGFTLPGSTFGSLVQAFTRTPLTHFANRTIARLASRCPRVSISLRPASSAAPCRNTVSGRGHPHRVLAPCRSQTFRREVPGLCVHLSSRRALLRTAR